MNQECAVALLNHIVDSHPRVPAKFYLSCSCADCVVHAERLSDVALEFALLLQIIYGGPPSKGQ